MEGAERGGDKGGEGKGRGEGTGMGPQFEKNDSPSSDGWLLACRYI